jgi:cyclic lactone autoinducer peptide
VKNKLFMLIATVGASVLTFFAFMASASACWASLYQPEEPKALREE